jgi:hypothetical protein
MIYDCESSASENSNFVLVSRSPFCLMKLFNFSSGLDSEQRKKSIPIVPRSKHSQPSQGGIPKGSPGPSRHIERALRFYHASSVRSLHLAALFAAFFGHRESLGDG